MVQLLTVYTGLEDHNAPRYSWKDGRTDRQAD